VRNIRINHLCIGLFAKLQKRTDIVMSLISVANLSMGRVEETRAQRIENSEKSRLFIGHFCKRFTKSPIMTITVATCGGDRGYESDNEKFEKEPSASLNEALLQKRTGNVRIITRAATTRWAEEIRVQNLGNLGKSRLLMRLFCKRELAM